MNKKEIQIRQEFKESGITDLKLLSVSQEREYGKTLRWFVELECSSGHVDKKRYRGGNFTCSKCSYKEVGKKSRISDEKISSYIWKHSDGYSLLKSWIPDDRKSTRITIRCNKGHTYDEQWSDFKKGRRCTECFHIYGSPKLNNEIFEYFNVNQEYELIDIKRVKKSYTMAYITVKCPDGHIYDVHWNKFKGSKAEKPRRCPICASSLGEKEVRRVLDLTGKNYQSEFSFDDCKYDNKLEFDFVVFDGETPTHAIEFDGHSHFHPVRWSSEMTEEDAEKLLEKVKHKDEIKNNYCLENDIKMIRIPYWEINNIKSILEELL